MSGDTHQPVPVVARQRSVYPLLHWGEIKSIIANEQLEKLGRSDEQQVVYDAFRAKLNMEWFSIRDYILCTKFNFRSKPVGPDDIRLVADVDGTPKDECRKSTLILNDFPYNFEDGVLHYVYWKIGEPIVEAELRDCMASLLRDVKNAKDTTYYVNPPHLKSILDVDHGHILVYCGDLEYPK